MKRREFSNRFLLGVGALATLPKDGQSITSSDSTFMEPAKEVPIRNVDVFSGGKRFNRE